MHHAHRLAQVLQQAADKVLPLQPAAGTTVTIAGGSSPPVPAPAITAIGRVESLLMLIVHRQPPASFRAIADRLGFFPAVAWGEAMVVLPLRERLSNGVDHGCRRRLAEVWMLIRQSVNILQSLDLGQRVLLARGHGG